jgi:hypothetical protein
VSQSKGEGFARLATLEMGKRFEEACGEVLLRRHH